ncbi:MAG: hypothetical protein IPK39_20235 [Sulfuritalea sp.]|nr:hypothetical protein [Sulfuritalea sp.]
MIERYVEGEVHRLVVVRGRLWKTIRRDRPYVVGDGRSTLLSLTEARNEPLRRQTRPGVSLAPSASVEFPVRVAPAGFGRRISRLPASGPPARHPAAFGRSCLLRRDRAGTPDVAVMAEALARAFGVAASGLDYITTDIGRSCFEQGAFIEINLTPACACR